MKPGLHFPPTGPPPELPPLPQGAPPTEPSGVLPLVIVEGKVQKGASSSQTKTLQKVQKVASSSRSKKKTSPFVPSLEGQEVEPRWRAELVDWLVDVQVEFNFVQTYLSKKQTPSYSQMYNNVCSIFGVFGLFMCQVMLCDYASMARDAAFTRSLIVYSPTILRVPPNRRNPQE